MGHKCYSVQCIVNGKENPKIAPSPWDCVTPPEEDRATAINNMHKNGKDRACGSGDMLADRQTRRHIDRHTRTRSLQYFATALAGEVVIFTVQRYANAVHAAVLSLSVLLSVTGRYLTKITKRRIIKRTMPCDNPGILDSYVKQLGEIPMRSHQTTV